jgi:DNA-binding CsgD family transcriptional regulator
MQIDVSPTRHRAVAWLARSLDDAGQKHELSRALQDIGRCLGVKHVALAMQHVPGVVAENSLVEDTFGPSWRQHAASQKYDAVDPVRLAATVQDPVIDWGEMPRDGIRNRRYIRDFHDFQLGRKAITVLHRGYVGDRSLLTVTSDVTERRWQLLRDDIIGALGVIHPALHRFVLRTRYNITEPQAVRLTPRERECLGWAAHGRTSKEIGEVLGLTPATVNFFIDAAVQKLDALNRAHAAAKAVAFGLIAPPR